MAALLIAVASWVIVDWGSAAGRLPGATGVATPPTRSISTASISTAPTSTPVPLVPSALTIGPSTQVGHLRDPVVLDVRVSDVRGRGVPSVSVAFDVVGVNGGASGECQPVDCRTDDDGEARFLYTGTGLGQDEVTAEVSGIPVSGASRITWTPSIRGSSLAVLGDSYSSGEGAGSYLAGTDSAGVNSCHRSSLSYAELVQAREHLTSLAFRACSGTVTDDLFAPNSGGNQLPGGTAEPAQLCVECGGRLPAAVGPDTQAVTLTIGGNDAGFASVLSSCVWVSELNLNYGRPGRGCSDQQSITAPVVARISALGGTSAQQVSAPNGRPVHSVSEILHQIHALAPSATIYLLGYPHLFEAGADDCFVGRIDVAYAGRRISVTTKVTPKDARWMDSVADDLNAAARSAATAAGGWVSFVDVVPVFTGHGLCTAAPWINGDSGTLTVRSTHDVQASINPGSFHPSEQGQQAYAQALRSAGL